MGSRGDGGTGAGKLYDPHDFHPGWPDGDLSGVLLRRELYHNVLLAPFLAGFQQWSELWEKDCQVNYTRYLMAAFLVRSF